MRKSESRQQAETTAGEGPEQGAAPPGRPRPKAGYSIIEREGYEKSYWLRLGTAYVNRDQSLTVILNALPVNHRLHIRELPDRD